MRQIIKWSIFAALSTSLVGMTAIAVSRNLEQPNNSSATASNIIAPDVSKQSEFNLLNDLPPSQRLTQLELQAKAAEPSVTRDRSRYVLATIYLANRKPQAALDLLADLETTYPVLADYVLWKRSQAQALINPLAAKQTWQQILTLYPQSPVAAEALLALGQPQQVLAKYPSHPRARTILKNLLKTSSNRYDLLSPMAVYFNDDAAIVPVLDRLVANYRNQLTPAQWEAIAKGYFDQAQYTKASLAYPRASVKPMNFYLWGRSLQRSNQKAAAFSAYNQLVANYPNHPLAPRALIRMMDVAEPGTALKVGDQIVANYANTAAEALFKKANILEAKFGDGNTANRIRQLILTNHAKTTEAATILWNNAQRQARTGNLTQAIALTKQIVNNVPDTEDANEIAAEAGYWGGKWSTRMGDRVTATQNYQTVITKHTESYFAWRSAVQLGWPVGDFTTARNLRVALKIPNSREPLPAGSAGLQELYILGQDQDASDRWQFETRGKSEQNVKEIFTDGVLRVGVNDNLRGLRQVESLFWLDVTPAEKIEIQTILKRPTFWQTLYPFPYWEPVSRWANATNLNPALVIALIRQESRFEAQITSSAGAIGLMQIMPDTGNWIASKKRVANYSLRNPDQNVEFGTWYLDYTHREYGNNSMLAVASYNAGPGKVREWVNSFGVSDPDEFAQRIPYDETKGYVRHVLGNYWNYLRLYSPQIQQQIAQINQGDQAYGKK